MYRSLFPRDFFADMDRLQREMQQAFDLSPTIRGFGRHSFPALNVGTTPEAIEVYAFAPGVDPQSIEVHVEQGLLTISGERGSPLSQLDERASVHINERFAGKFRRALALPEDANGEAVTAQMREGLLHVTVPRKQATQPRRVQIQPAA
ncbi:Hsp20/alpha crystallin family protein [Roseateles chitinivorans]|uniref:Hsp20/alpha crystallin family protein n=1 Tax=Roseateles chitinivorans TaxID=2917965 RepID=UPI003D667266